MALLILVFFIIITFRVHKNRKDIPDALSGIRYNKGLDRLAFDDSHIGVDGMEYDVDLDMRGEINE